MEHLPRSYLMNLQTYQYETKTVALKPKVDIEVLVETNLPPSPGNIMRLTKLLNDVNTPARKITEVVGYEPMLAAHILRLANSPIYGLERKVTLIEAAIKTIGNERLNEIVMMGLGSSTFAKQIRASVIARKIWEHSLAVAMIARELSKELKMKGTEEAFTCGLLHDIGKLILFTHDFQDFSTTLTENDENKMLYNERQLYGYDHAQVGSLVARRWGLQDEVCDTICYHHNPAMAPHPTVVTHIVEAADIIANVKGYGLRCENESALSASASVKKLGLTLDGLETTWNNTEESIKEVIQTFI